MKKIYPVLLAGGSGIRLWPLSRKSFPKQFSKFTGDVTLFQDAALRLISSEIIEFYPHLILTNFDFRFIIEEQLRDIKINNNITLIEPVSKNTAPAILAASLFLFSKDPEAVLLVSPTDQHIPSMSSFHSAVKLGLEQIEYGKMVTFGISPNRPETAYGYLELALQNENNVSLVTKFIEKPKYNEALQMLATGNYLWNAGIFLFKAKDMIDAFKNLSPDILKYTKKALDEIEKNLNFLHLSPEAWGSIPAKSIDYAIMEKAKNLVAVPYSGKWSDLGSWDSVWLETQKGSSELALSGGAHAIDCKNSIIRTENDDQQIVGLGLDNIIAVAMPDAVLVASKDSAQEVKRVVQYLKAKDLPQAENYHKKHRPWGWFENLSNGSGYQVKKIFVKPNAALSLQSHKYRSEYWVVVQGNAKVTVDSQIKYLSEGQSIYVPIGSIHRLENIGKVPMLLIEVQIGTYLEEDDIIRYEDLYKRL